MSRWPFVLLVAAVYVLHQDFWFWRQARPLLFGFMPVGLFYHVCYTLAVSMTMWLLVRYAWPHHLDETSGSRGQESQGRRVEKSKGRRVSHD